MTNEITAQHVKALELHNRIMVSAQLVQTNLWDMCNGLKEMRDGKLYKELGYQNFEEYCETECGFSRQQAHKYISIIENVKLENVNPGLHFGVRKLYLLSTLSESDQQKITAENDVESMTVKELEKEIKELRQTNSDLEDEVDRVLKRMSNTQEKAITEQQNAKSEIKRLQDEIDELRSRPIDVAVAEPSDDVRQLKETIKNLERTTDEELDRLQREHEADIRELHEENRKETARRLDEQRREYEQKLSEAEQSADAADDKQVFKAYYTAVYDAFNRMLDFAKKSADKEFFRDKIDNLLTAFATGTNKM